MSKWNKPTKWVCVGCSQKAGSTVGHGPAEPKFEGPADEWGCNLYCEKSLGKVTPEQLLSALYAAVRETDYWLIVGPKSESMQRWLAEDEYGTWDACLEAGRSYLVGRDVPMATFVKTHTSTITSAWMKLAVKATMADDNLHLRLKGDRLEYVIYRRGEYIEIGLPYHDHGGERHWITRDCKHRVLINVD